jgi:hypothetical protein
MSEPVVVCGFSDPAAEIAGLAWSLDGAEGGLLLAAGEVHAAAARIIAGEASTQVSLEAPIAGCEAELRPQSGPAALPSQDGLQGAEAALATTSFELTKGGASGSKECDGHLTQWAESPVAGASVLRHLALPALDGSLLLAVAVRPDGTAEHDDELAGAWILSPDGKVSPFGEALISTEYDAARRPVRAGLELWPEEADGPPGRAAGTRLGGAEEDQVAAALLDAAVEGFRGIGSYLLWRS